MNAHGYQAAPNNQRAPSQGSQQAEQPPYPTMPYPGFTHYHTMNQSSESIGQRISHKEQRYRQFGNNPVNQTHRPVTDQRLASVTSLDSNYSVQAAPSINEVEKSRQRSLHSFASNGSGETYSPVVNDGMQQYQDSITHDNGGASGSGNPVVDDLSRQLNVKLTVDDDVPENVQRFNKMKELSVDDYNSNGQFNPQIQLDWVTILLEYTGDETFMKTYNINGEKLSKELTHQEVKKNEHIFIKQAIKLLKKITSVAKTPDSQFLLGSLYSNSPIIKIGRPNILEKNYEKSFGYYQKAASQGHPLALYRLAVSYELGIGTAVNETKALDCFIKSANLKCVPSMFKLGIIYSRGALRALRSAKYSYYWFEKASEFASVENPHALFELAKIYERDFPFLAKGVTPTPSDIEYLTELDRLGIFKDDKRAIFYYKEASRFKYPPAQYKLGWCYEYGRLDCVIDAKKSIGWYSRSASQGYPSAEMALSGWYLTGAKGILEPNDKEAYLWASKAASVGFAKAEYAIGYYCEVGLGCDVDLEKSRKFYIRAATQGHNKAIERLKRFRK